MPELPEVETIVRSLNETVRCKQINRVKICHSKVIAYPDPEVFIKEVQQKTILNFKRRGKYILMELNGNAVIVVHLRMTGQLVYQPNCDTLPKHTHLVFHLEQGLLRFSDLRQFGRIHLVTKEELVKLSGLSTLGIEPLSEDFTKEYFAKKVSGSQRMIKPLLLDQTFIAGLGNIYTDEALHRAGVHPERKASNLKKAEIKRLFQKVQEVLEQGVALRGTSVEHYVDGTGAEGGFQNMLKVYGKKNTPCAQCGHSIIRIKCGGRGTHFCETCQPPQ